MRIGPRFFCVALYILLACLACAALLAAHGGWKGDVDPYIWHMASAQDRAVHAPGMLFNRWRITHDSEPLLYRVFLAVNAPAHLAALGTYRLLENCEAFRGMYPFGLSYPTYQLCLLLVFGLLQWYATGAAIDGLNSRRVRASAGRNRKALDGAQ